MSLAETRFAPPPTYPFLLHLCHFPVGCGVVNVRPMRAAASPALVMSATRPSAEPGEVEG